MREKSEIKEAASASDLEVDLPSTSESKSFRVKARAIGLPEEWFSGSVSELLEMLEGPLHR
jgi:hypothetical protein